jgi:hypothetical protein
MTLENGFVLKACIAGDSKRMYLLTLCPADYQVSNWYSYNHQFVLPPDAYQARSTPEPRYELRNNSVAIHRMGGTEKRR